LGHQYCRAFGTQLLCEQVVGRGLRRQSYDLNPETRLFDVEYADIMRIPFDFAASPQDAKPTKPVTRVHAIKEREAPEIVFPRVSGYRRDLPSEKARSCIHPGKPSSHYPCRYRPHQGGCSDAMENGRVQILTLGTVGM
jgi:hypothetical protein